MPKSCSSKALVSSLHISTVTTFADNTPASVALAHVDWEKVDAKSPEASHVGVVS